MAAANNKPILINDTQENFFGNQDHLDFFKKMLAAKGIKAWNKWLSSAEERNINLRGISLSGLPLSQIDFSGADLRKADFRHAELEGARFSGAYMWDTVFDHANLSRVDFNMSKLPYASFVDCPMHNASIVWADLTLANFQGAKLIKVNLSYSNMSGADLSNADLSGSTVTGVSTWNIVTDSKTIQKDLEIEQWIEPLQEVSGTGLSRVKDILIKSDDIEAAYLLYNLKKLDDNQRSIKIKSIIDAMTDKIVLLLGNFGRQRKAILKAVRKTLSKEGYVPVIFDFPSPKDRDMIETVAILAGLSRFVIADFTSPNSTPLEALLIIPGLRVPFAPVVLKGKEIFPMFSALKKKYEWVLEPWEYENKAELLNRFKEKIIRPCEKKRREYIN